MQPVAPVKPGVILSSKTGAKGKYDMKALFLLFDADGDGKLDIHEFARAFRALGLPKRNGDKLEIDQATFQAFGV